MCHSLFSWISLPSMSTSRYVKTNWGYHRAGTNWDGNTVLSSVNREGLNNLHRPFICRKNVFLLLLLFHRVVSERQTSLQAADGERFWIFTQIQTEPRLWEKAFKTLHGLELKRMQQLVLILCLFWLKPLLFSVPHSFFKLILAEIQIVMSQRMILFTTVKLG